MRRRDFLALASLAPAIRPALARFSRQQADFRVDDIAALVVAKMAEYHVPGVAFGIYANNLTTCVDSA